MKAQKDSKATVYTPKANEPKNKFHMQIIKKTLGRKGNK